LGFLAAVPRARAMELTELWASEARLLPRPAQDDLG
jgi:hypothetical protein